MNNARLFGLEQDAMCAEYEARQADLPDPALKGIKGGNCNVTACQKPGATFFNKSTERYYCRDCANEINWPGGRADCMALYGTPLLCEEDDEMHEAVMYRANAGPEPDQMQRIEDDAFIKWSDKFDSFGKRAPIRIHTVKRKTKAEKKALKKARRA